MKNYTGLHPFVKSEPELLQRPPAFDAFSVAGVCVEQLDATYQQILKALEALLSETFGRVEIVMEGKHCFEVSPILTGAVPNMRRGYYVTTPSELRSALAHGMTADEITIIQVAPELRKVLCGIPGTKIEGPEMIMRPNATPEQIRELGPRATDDIKHAREMFKDFEPTLPQIDCKFCGCEKPCRCMLEENKSQL